MSVPLIKFFCKHHQRWSVFILYRKSLWHSSLFAGGGPGGQEETCQTGALAASLHLLHPSLCRWRARHSWLHTQEVTFPEESALCKQAATSICTLLKPHLERTSLTGCQTCSVRDLSNCGVPCKQQNNHSCIQKVTEALSRKEAPFRYSPCHHTGTQLQRDCDINQTPPLWPKSHWKFTSALNTQHQNARSEVYCSKSPLSSNICYSENKQSIQHFEAPC